MLVVDEKTMNRFWAKVQAEPNSGCWLWEGATNKDGYGTFKFREKMVRAHRFSYETQKGFIPDGLQIDHLCRVRNCVNPVHLEPVTQAENARRGEGGKYLKDRTHCLHGHPFSGDNFYTTIPAGRRTSRRVCRTCKRASDSRNYYKRKAIALAALSP